MPDTSTSSAPASDMMRAAVCTASPRTRAGHDLDLSGVQPGADGEAQLARGLDHRLGAGHSASRSIEDGEQPVAGGVDLAASVSVQLGLHALEMPSQQVPPRGVADLLERGR